MGEIIRQEKKQKRKEKDKVCTLHSDFVTAQRTEADSGVFGEKNDSYYCRHINSNTLLLFFPSSPKVKIMAFGYTFSLRAVVHGSFQFSELK